MEPRDKRMLAKKAREVAQEHERAADEALDAGWEMKYEIQMSVSASFERFAQILEREA